MFANEVLRRSNDVRIESSAQPAIDCHHDHENAFFGTNFEHWMRNVFDARSKVAQHTLQLSRIWAGAEHALLGAAQFCGGDGFHCLRQLLRVFDRTDPAPDIKKTWHTLLLATPFRFEFLFGVVECLLEI